MFLTFLTRFLELAELLGHCGGYLWERGQNDVAFDLLMIAKRTCDSLLVGTSHATTALIYNNLGGVYNVRGKRAETAEISRIAVELREACLDPDDQDLATAYTNYAADLNALDCLDEPKIDQSYQKALPIRALRRNTESGPELHGQTLSNAERYWARVQRYAEAEKAF